MIHEPRRFACICTRQIGNCDFQGQCCGVVEKIVSSHLATVAPWYVCVSNTNCERRATQGLLDRGFEVWYPTRISVTRNRYTRKPIETVRPLYAGYLFTRLGTAPDWQAMYGVDGVKTVLLNDQRPMTVSDAIMETIRKEAAIFAVELPERLLEVGGEVVITHGPFAGLRASLTRILGLSAVEVALDVMGLSTPVSVSREHVEKV